MKVASRRKPAARAGRRSNGLVHLAPGAGNLQRAGNGASGPLPPAGVYSVNS